MNAKHGNNEMFEKFRGIKILKIEAEVLREIESLTNVKLNVINDIEWIFYIISRMRSY